MTQYFLYLDDTIHGPLSAQVIESMLRAGTILPDTPAAAEGTSEWSTAGQLFNVQSQPTPAPRPPSVNAGGAMPGAMSQCGLPARKPKLKSVWPAATAAFVVVITILAFFLSHGTKRASPVVTTAAPAAPATAPATPATTTTPVVAMPAPTDPAQGLRKRAEAGDADAQYQLAMTYWGKTWTNLADSNEVLEMTRWLEKSAEHGQPEAQSALATCYDSGKGVAQDYAAARIWYRKAAAQGIDHACFENSCYQIGRYYHYGLGVPKDTTEAAKWYRQGVNRSAFCRLAMAQLYLEGDGVAKDLAQALMWLELASLAGLPDLPDGQRVRDACNNGLASEQIAEAKRLASEWKPDSSSKPGGQ